MIYYVYANLNNNPLSHTFFPEFPYLFFFLPVFLFKSI